MIFIHAGSTSTQLNSLTEKITDTLNSRAVYFQFPIHFLQTKKLADSLKVTVRLLYENQLSPSSYDTGI